MNLWETNKTPPHAPHAIGGETWMGEEEEMGFGGEAVEP